MNKLFTLLALLVIVWTLYSTYQEAQSSTGAGSDFIQSAHGQVVEDEDDIFIFMPAILSAANSWWGNSLERSCIKRQSGQVGSHTIPTLTTGRLAIGDVDGDGSVDYVVSNRNRVRTYNVCGKLLWSKSGSTNWDVHAIGSGSSENSHVYWNWSSLGFVGDVDGDGDGDFIHVAGDFRTLVIRDGKTGNVLWTKDLGSGRWHNVGFGNGRIFVTQDPGHMKVKTFYVSGNSLHTGWSIDNGFIQNRYAPATIADINGDGYMDIAHGSMAWSGINGSILYRHDFTGQTIIGSHTLNVRDLDPAKTGLETSWSMYGPRSGAPSIEIADRNGGLVHNYHSGHHPHGHTIGEFDTSVPGLEIMARHNDGKSHWLINSHTGATIRENVRVNPRALDNDWGRDWDNDDHGEILHGIEWDDKVGTEMLYAERHVNFDNWSKLVVVNRQATAFLTPVFSGGHDPDPTLCYKCSGSWAGWMNRGGSTSNDGPYEANAHVADVIRDGREEIISIQPNKIVIYYNPKNGQVPKRWGTVGYNERKGAWTQVYNTR